MTPKNRKDKHSFSFAAIGLGCWGTSHDALGSFLSQFSCLISAGAVSWADRRSSVSLSCLVLAQDWPLHQHQRLLCGSSARLAFKTWHHKIWTGLAYLQLIRLIGHIIGFEVCLTVLGLCRRLCLVPWDDFFVNWSGYSLCGNFGGLSLTSVRVILTSVVPDRPPMWPPMSLAWMTTSYSWRASRSMFGNAVRIIPERQICWIKWMFRMAFYFNNNA